MNMLTKTPISLAVWNMDWGSRVGSNLKATPTSSLMTKRGPIVVRNLFNLDLFLMNNLISKSSLYLQKNIYHVYPHKEYKVDT